LFITCNPLQERFSAQFISYFPSHTYIISSDFSVTKHPTVILKNPFPYSAIHSSFCQPSEGPSGDSRYTTRFSNKNFLCLSHRLRQCFLYESQNKQRTISVYRINRLLIYNPVIVCLLRGKIPNFYQIGFIFKVLRYKHKGQELSQ